jgi:hypothetical protein
MSFSQLEIWSRSIVAEKNLFNNPVPFLEITSLLILLTDLLGVISFQRQ